MPSQLARQEACGRPPASTGATKVCPKSGPADCTLDGMRAIRCVWIGKAVALLLSAHSGCVPSEPSRATVESPASLVVLPGERLEQFSTVVRALKDQVERTRAVSSPEYAGVQMSLLQLADAIQLLPRSAEVLATIGPADAIRDDAVRVGSPVLDDPSRTLATKRGLKAAAQTLDRVARQAYRRTPSIAPRAAHLERTVDSIDESRILDLERSKVLLAFEDALAILEDMDRAVRLPRNPQN
jgi:hypothetical protein